MKLLFALIVILLPLSAFSIVCDHSNPHPSSNNCMRDGCAPGDHLCEQCCDEICTRCHTPPEEEADLSSPTQWNPDGVKMSEVWPEATEETTINLADVCSECHGASSEENRFAVDHNHPVDISYDSGKLNTDLVSSPNGPLLVCTQGKTECMVRCITCHILHPDLEDSADGTGLLRMNNQGSALCIACHHK